MRAERHLRLFCLATTVWTLFHLAGLGSRYDRGRPTPALVGASLLVVVATALAAPGMIRATREPPVRGAFWCAFD